MSTTEIKRAGTAGITGKSVAQRSPESAKALHFPVSSTSFGVVYRMGVIERIHAIQQGIDARSVGLLAKSMRRSKDRVAEMLGMSVTTIDRKAKHGDLLSQEQSERLFGAAKLIGQVQTMVEESGDPQGFDAAQWFAEWLDTPLKALGGKPPAHFMDTAEGRDLLSRLLATAQSGAYV